MSIAKVIEVLAEGDSIEAAAQAAVAEAGKTVRNIKTVYITDFQGIVENGSIAKYRVNAKVTFVVGG
jgi:hypothetical protein